MKIGSEQLQELVKLGYVSKRKHPSEELYIYNYTAKTQYQGRWTDLTLMCRGLILDSEYNIVARPFKKFFNMEELDVLPQGNYRVEEKMDGSLGIMYWVKGRPFIATRGSFTSPQAIMGTAMLRVKMMQERIFFDLDCTYLFEIIYPQNRIVVDYGKKRLVLLACIDTRTGEQKQPPAGDFDRPVSYPGDHDLKQLKARNIPNKEGYVITFDSGERVKIKFEEYLRLHRIVTGLSSKRIWECMRAGDDVMKLLEKVPDEFYQWAKKIQSKLTHQFNDIYDWATHTYSNCPECFTRKEYAMWAKNQKYPHLLFALLNGQPINDLIYRLIEPKHEIPFESNQHKETQKEIH